MMTDTYTLTPGQRSYVADRMACPLRQEDIAQAVAIRLWRADCRGALPMDPHHRENLAWMVVRQCTADARRQIARQPEGLDEQTADALPAREPTEPTADQAAADRLLRHAGSCAEAVRRWMEGAALTHSDRSRASRGLSRIRAAVGAGC